MTNLEPATGHKKAKIRETWVLAKNTALSAGLGALCAFDFARMNAEQPSNPDIADKIGYIALTSIFAIGGIVAVIGIAGFGYKTLKNLYELARGNYQPPTDASNHPSSHADSYRGRRQES